MQQCSNSTIICKNAAIQKYNDANIKLYKNAKTQPQNNATMQHNYATLLKYENAAIQKLQHNNHAAI